MKKIKKLLELSGIINIILSLILIPHVTIIGAFILITGMLLLSYSFLSIEELQKKRVSLIIMMIILFIFNIIDAILILITLDAISEEIKKINNNSPPIEKEILSAETKRIDLLLKVGLGMVITSGILFATTSWKIISDPVKVLILIIMSLLFLGLSKFSEEKLKIKRTTEGYFILGLSFLLFSWIGVGYFGIFSPWFSYSGAGKNLVYFITFSLIGLQTFIISKKFSKKELIYIAIMSIYLSIYHLLSFFNLTIVQITIILTAISTIINILLRNKKDNVLKQINNSISYTYWILILTNCYKENYIVVSIASILNIINLLYLIIKNKDLTKNIFTIIISYTLILTSIIKLNVSLDKCLIILTAISIFSLLLKFIKPIQQKSLLYTNQVIYILTSIVLIIIISTYDSNIKLLSATAIYLITNIINSIKLYKNDYHKIAYYTQPLTLTVSIFSIGYFIDANIISFNLMNVFSIIVVLFAIMHFFIKEKILKEVYFVLLLITTILTFLVNCGVSDILAAFSILIVSIYVYFINKKDLKIPSYIFILLNIYMAVDTIKTIYGTNFYTNLIVLLIYGILIFSIKDKKLKTTTNIMLLLPLYNLLISSSFDDIIKQIIFNLFQVYILFLILKFIVKNEKIRDIVACIGLSIILIQIIFVQDILVILYVGILGIIAIMISFHKKEYKALFYTGIVITIANIIIQLWNYWTQIPFWLYLLLCGIFIIVFVTYKEVNKQDTIELKQDMKKQNEEITINKRDVLFCPRCGTKNRGGKFCPKCGNDLTK